VLFLDFLYHLGKPGPRVIAQLQAVPKVEPPLGG